MNKPFTFGTATASFQIEGASYEDGRTSCIWDIFCAQPGRIDTGEDGSVACDHYHRYKEDIALMAELGIDSYRFSIAWPRIFPEYGRYNQKGMQFYKNILKELKCHGVKAAVTLYHWDLPQWAQDKGGWENRECAGWFTDYAEKCFEQLDEDVDLWITHNEPWCASFLSNLEGEHAPGNTNMEKALRVAHHILLSHGMAVECYRSKPRNAEIGITLNLVPVYPEIDCFGDHLARDLHDGYQNRWFLEPLFNKKYPSDMSAFFGSRSDTDFDFIKNGDFDIIASHIDFLGVNFYTHSVVRYSSAKYLLTSRSYTDLPKTDMDWDICPERLKDLIQMLRSKYTELPIYITENGCAFQDQEIDGKIHDSQRIDYLLRHLNIIEDMNREGLNIAGYYYWSFMDNFEWARGYSKRFGLIYVDYTTQERYPKDSFYAYKDYIKQWQTKT